MKNDSKSIEIITSKLTCDFPWSTSFENIRYVYDPRCFEREIFTESKFYDSLNMLIKSKMLVEDTISKKPYGYNLVVYINLTLNDSIHNEIGIDHKGTVFANNKLYHPSVKLNRLLCKYSETFKKLYCEN